MSADLATRTPILEWAHRSANGQVDGLSWVSTTLHPDFHPFRHFVEGGEHKFRHRPFSRWQPPSLVESTMEAQAAGVPTAWEALHLVFARTEWLMAGREYLWTPQSPEPLLLSTLVETFGIEAALHRRSKDTLRRLTALLPNWHPYRGTVARAREVLRICGLEEQLESATTIAESGRLPKRPALEGEVMTCHVGSWWKLRRQPDSRCELRIQDGLLRFQPEADENKWVLRREDVLVEWNEGATLPKEALRLLPAWSVVRLARRLPASPEPEAEAKGKSSSPRSGSKKKKQGNASSPAADSAKAPSKSKSSKAAEAKSERDASANAKAKSNSQSKKKSS